MIRYLFAHSRAQFHPAAWALTYAVLFFGLMVPCLFVLSLTFKAFGSTGIRFDYQTTAELCGPVLFGELVRGHVKVGLGYRPEEWCFPSIGSAGFAAGGVFGAVMALRWGHPWWLEVPGWGTGVAVLYLFIGWMIRLDEKKRRGSIRFG